MKENLNVGDRIGTAVSPSDNGIIEKYCYKDDEANCDVYGGLYTWDEMMSYSGASGTNPSGVRGICPEEWHVPSSAEITQLKLFLGGQSVAGGALKETGTQHWKKPNTGATDASGFTGRGSGYVSSGSSFNQLLQTSFWTTSRYFYQPQQKWYSWTMTLSSSSAKLSQPHYAPGMGQPVRCVKD